jgi:hypothetical protein
MNDGPTSYKEEEEEEGKEQYDWPDTISDNDNLVPKLLETYKAWIPHTALEIEDRIDLIETIVK